LDERDVRPADVVIGITANGRTPFVLGALARAKSLGAKAMLVTCNPHCSHRPVAGPDDGPQGRGYSDFDLVITLPVGPEILAGSTRLKAGTATKVALNIISTGAMIGLGKVRGNRMIDLYTTSTKLRDRAVRIVAELTQRDYESARGLLETNAWNLRATLEQLYKFLYGISATEVARAKIGMFNRKEQSYALDNIRYSAGTVAAWVSQLIHDGRVHSHPARDRDCRADYPTDLPTPGIITSKR